MRGWVLTWARDIEIARRPERSACHARAKGNLAHENPVIAQEALGELSAVLDEETAEHCPDKDQEGEDQQHSGPVEPGAPAASRDGPPRTA